MSGARIVLIQPHAEASVSAQAGSEPAIVRVGPNVQVGPMPDMRQTIQDAMASASREMAQAVREAQQHVRTAEQHVREARTDDQRGAANQELFAARTELSALQDASRMGRMHTEQPSPIPRDLIPPQLVDISIAFFIMVAVIIIGWPLARAMGRRLERRADAPALPDPAITGQLQRIEQAVEAMAIEIERISESQRFLAKLQSSAPERMPLGAGERR